MVRRTFEIWQAQDTQIEAIARRTGLGKSDVVRLALGQGLPIVDGHLEGDVIEKLGGQLNSARVGSIKKPGAKRRA